MIDIEDEVRYKKRAKHKPVKKVDHKHVYEDVHVRQKSKRHNISIDYLGGKCTICGKIVKTKMYIFTEMPEYVKNLELIEEEV